MAAITATDGTSSDIVVDTTGMEPQGAGPRALTGAGMIDRCDGIPLGGQ